MNRLFPVIKHVSLSNLMASFVVVLAFYCQVLAVNGKIRVGITAFMFVLLLNEMEGALTVRLGQVTAFNKELAGLVEYISFIATPIVISYYMGFNGVYSLAFFALFLLTGIWMLSDSSRASMGQEEDKNRVRGLHCAHVSAMFVIVASAVVKFFNVDRIFVFALFFVITSMLMISAFSYGRNGKLAFSLYLLALASVILLWL